MTAKEAWEIIAIIPARGGSKGIPYKNLYPLADKSLISWTIEAALASNQISRVIVSTDDNAIAAISKNYGAEIIMRPAELATDTASSESVLLHALDYLRTHEDYEPDTVVFLQATSPLRAQDDIDNAVAIFKEQEADSLFSACPVHGFIWKNASGILSPVTYDYHHRPRRQEAEEYLMENGSIYIFKPWVLRKHNNRLGGKIAAYKMNPLYSYQIDVPEDLDTICKLLEACH